MLFKSIKKNWFTLVEVLLVCSIFAIMVVGIILAVSRSYTFMNNTKLQIQATNLAREWVEMMFNIRDTNWRKCSWKKDKFWLYLGTGSSNESICDISSANPEIFKEWIYSINEWKNWSWDTYLYGLRITTNTGFYSDEWFWAETEQNSSNRNKTKVLFTGTYYYASWLQVKSWNIKDLLEGVEFYRVVRIYGIYNKNVNDSSATTDIWDLIDKEIDSKVSDPKELRFCVKVFYRNNWDPHSSELCSIMTNFEE